MSIFKDMLKSGETLFRDTVFLSYDFQPKILYGRENEQQRFAVAIKPLLQEHNTYKIFYKICEEIGFKFLHNKNTNELFAMVKSKLNKGGAVFVFDEID